MYKILKYLISSVQRSVPALLSGIMVIVMATSVAKAGDDKDAKMNGAGEASSLEIISAERIYFSDLRRYPIDRPNADVPENIATLEGQEIEIVGYMVPFDRIENISQFILLQAPFMGCMHIPPPGPHETLMIKTDKPMASYTQDAIRITGEMSIEEVYVDGYLISVYTIQASDISAASDADAELDDLPDNFHMY